MWESPFNPHSNCGYFKPWRQTVTLIFATLFLIFNQPVAEAKETLVVALGASVTAGYGLHKDDAFPARLEKILRGKGHQVRVLNAGIGDDTSEGMLRRLSTDVPEGTHFVVYQPGANDTGGNTNENVAKILDTLARRGIKVFLYPSRMLDMQGKKVAQEHGAKFIGGQLQEAMGGSPGARTSLPAKYFLTDGTHLNEIGHQKVAEVLAKLIEPSLSVQSTSDGGSQGTEKQAQKFSAMDANGDGKISREELFSKLPEKMPLQKKNQILNSFDEDNSGEISFAEFAKGHQMSLK